MTRRKSKRPQDRFDKRVFRSEEPEPNPRDRDIENPIATSVEMQRSFFTSYSGQLRNASKAYWDDREYQRFMLLDPDIVAPLRAYTLVIAGAEVEVRPAPGEQRVDEALAIAEWCNRVIHDIPNLTDLRLNLLNSVWYGPGAVNTLWRKDERGVVPFGWVPIHSDSLVCDRYGALGAKVGPEFTFKPGASWEMGIDSQVHWYTPDERLRIVLMTWNVSAADFYELFLPGQAYLGKGVRDEVWYPWKSKMAVEKAWVQYCERYATGYRTGYYPTGNKRARARMEEILKNLSGDFAAAFPRDQGAETSDRDGYEIVVHEPNAANADTFLMAINRYSAKIKELIVGQSLTSEAAGTGLGSGVAKAHENTAYQRVVYGARKHDEALTCDLLGPLLRSNFKDPPRLVVRSTIEKPALEEYLSSVEKFVGLGGKVRADEVRERIGVAKPEEGEEVLERGSMPLIDNPFGSKGGVDDEDEEGED